MEAGNMSGLHIMDIGYSAGRGAPNEQVNSEILARRFFAPVHNSARGMSPNGRTFSTWSDVDAAVQRLAPEPGKYWVRTDTGKVYSGYARSAQEVA